MGTSANGVRSLCVAAVGFCLMFPVMATAQSSYRPGTSNDDPIQSPRDLSGYSVRSPRIRIVHTTDPAQAGGSKYLQEVDPFLGYLWGRDLTQREWRVQDGAFGETGKLDGLLLPDGSTHVMSRDHVNSCGVCHNTPYRDAGSGMVVPMHGGTGRDTPHLFGAGLLEMIASELRLAALRTADTDRNGWIDLLEAKDKKFIHRTAPKGIKSMAGELDFGRFDDHDLDGEPDLNGIFYIVYVDGDGKRIPWAEKLTDAGVKGYRLEVQVFGQGRMRVSNRPPLAGTLRGFTAGAFDMHHGLQAYDPTTLADDDRDGISATSNAGCIQYITAAGRDRGRVMRGAKSCDDPDRDGVEHELTEGDLDMAEWYLLNHPRPARGRQTARTANGETLFAGIGCTSCHTPDWYLPAANPNAADYTERHAGDRRFFDLNVAYDEPTRRLQGTLNRLSKTVDGRLVPLRGACLVDGLYSDLRYHDLGEKFHQVQFDGTVVKQFRTAPLWGVGSTAPYGHDGASLSLDDVIVRHGGEAASSRNAYLQLNAEQQEDVQAFLRSLVLYQTDTLPCDLNGNGRVEEDFAVAGQHVGLETFRPEWLLNTPCRIEGPVTNLLGERVVSMAITNLRQAYGLDLPLLRDRDEDGWPDALPHRMAKQSGE